MRTCVRMILCVLLPRFELGVAAGDRELRTLEGIGAAVESHRPGLACFDAAALRPLHGGAEGVLAATRRALRRPARLGAGPTRFSALAAATRARSRRAEVVRGDAGAYLAPLPVRLLRARAETAALPEPLERLGIATLGELARLSDADLADRFGTAG